METTHSFSFRRHEGRAAVRFGENKDPGRWGYDVLGLPWPSSLAFGLQRDAPDQTTAPETPSPHALDDCLPAARNGMSPSAGAVGDVKLELEAPGS